MNFKQLKDFDFKNIEIDRNQFERITVGIIILCALSLFLVTIKTQHSIKIDGTKITYKGQMQNHRLNGQGTLTYDNGDTYTGEFKNGSFNYFCNRLYRINSDHFTTGRKVSRTRNNCRWS